ncbi:hybrid-cluster NAD(P)-dependent oxidoreductase [Ornithinimicrobium murale]|uniref:hybrid-cluster NAD(P)-dependent oxidoreductase n=1 Tax=Ornithinimicrobium murale TaxID=1050153 RepID=UPI000E0CD97D|nr:hybrid-cluster NAD(P)-dependent oxidoreductase [Ornithinimicrobium murale]
MTELLRRAADPEVVGRLTDDFDGTLTCVEITPITHDVTSFAFELRGRAGLVFAPGQYLTLSLVVDGHPVERCYTLSSSPAQPERPTITVKRQPDGPVSTWLHDHLQVGDTVRAAGPYGLFSTATHPAEKYLFLSAGSGVTPLMSMTRALRDGVGVDGRPADVAFVHCARTPEDIIFRAELEELAAHGGASVTFLCQEDSPHEAWTGARGRLTLPALLTAAPDLLDREIFTCGPPGFMAAVREHLELIAADPARCHQESFVLDAGAPPDPEPPRDAPDEPAATTYQVTFRRSGRVIDCPGTVPVLTAAAEAGLTMPSSCGEGVCGTCKNTLLSGRVDMRHAGGIRPREIEDGKFLLCCSKPLGDLEIDA